MSSLKCIILLIWLMYFADVNAQPNLDYSHYHIKFQDDFLYPDPGMHYPSTAFQSNAKFNKYWSLFVNDSLNSCLGYGSEIMNPDHVTMPRYGIIRLTENRNRNEGCDPAPGNYRSRGAFHVSGMLRSKRKVSCGIIEARIKLPPGRGRTSAWPAFWIPSGELGKSFNEIDIVDNINNSDETSITSNVYLNLGMGNNAGQSAFYFFSLAQYAGKTVTPKSLTEPLSSDFHKYSCLWTPSRITFYFDEQYISHVDYTKEQLFPSFQQLIISLQTDTFTVDGLTMDVDWVKYWVQNADEAFILTDNDTHNDIMDYPMLPPFFDKRPQFNTNKHKNITINVPDKNSNPIETQKDWATVFNAPSTTILPNFVADQSEYRTKKIFRNDFTYHDISSNGYMEIAPINDDPDNLDEDDDKNFGEHPDTGESIIIYPNPNNGQFQISMSEPGDYDITIINVLGMPIMRTFIKNGDRKEITLGNTVPSGTYLIHIIGKSNELIKKLSVIK